MRSERACGRSWCWAPVCDTFAYRLEQTPDLRVFEELDHPATQAEKRRRLTEAQIAEPDVYRTSLTIQSGGMTAALKAAGLDPDGARSCCGSASRPT